MRKYILLLLLFASAAQAATVIVVDKTTKTLHRVSAATAAQLTPYQDTTRFIVLTAGQATTVDAIPEKYRKIVSNAVQEMIQSEKDAVDSASLAAKKQRRIDYVEARFVDKLNANPVPLARAILGNSTALAKLQSLVDALDAEEAQINAATSESQIPDSP